MKDSGSERHRRHGARTVSAQRLDASGDSLAHARSEVIVEDVLTVEVVGVGSYSLMWTPTQRMLEPVGYTGSDGLLGPAGEQEPLALAAGFCFTEGLITGIEDIDSIAVCPGNPRTVRVQLIESSRARMQRLGGLVTSSCAICGGSELIENGLHGLNRVPEALRVDSAMLAGMASAMHERQVLFQATGGAHAAAIFTSDGSILAIAEDLGRHNALDKVIGTCLLRDQSLRACGVVLSSRLSFEMIVKAARARLELVAAVSAPTSLAIDTADRFGITLCGFVRDNRVTVYTHAARVQDGSRRFERRLTAAG